MIRMQGSILLLLLLSLISAVYSSCYISSAKWDKGTPKVSQTSKTDPSKVLVDWSAIIKNSKCVDKYYLWVWKDGQQKGQGKKFIIPDKNTQTKIVDIEPCVFHNFCIELEEDDSSNRDLKPSETARYNSAALPSFNSNDVLKHFTLGYYQDPVSKQFDLTKASVKFETKFITFASCIKHVEVTGTRKSGAAGLSSAQKTGSTPAPVTTTATYSIDEISPRFGEYTWEPYGTGRNVGGNGGKPSRGWAYENGGYNSGSRGQGGYNPGAGGQGGYNPGAGGQGGYNPGAGGQGGYNPGSGGQGGYNPGAGGQGGYNPGSGGQGGNNPGSGGQGGYNPGSGGQGGQGYHPGTTSRPGSTTWGYNPGGRPPTDKPGGGWSYSTTARPDYSSTSRPGYSSNDKPSFWGSRSAFSKQFLRMSTDVALKAAGPVKKNPPFSSDIVEVLVPIEPCKEYVFEMKIINPQDKEIGKISGLELQTLADIEDFIPPPLTSVILVEFIGGGKHRVTTQPNSPVPESCLPDYMEAMDAYANRLETVANDESNKNTKTRKSQFKEQQKVEVTQAQILTNQGCVCSSPRLEFLYVPSGSDPSGYSQFSYLLGVYLYEGIWDGKPYYKQDLERRSTSEFIPRSSSGTRRKRFIGRVDGGGTTTTKLPWNYGVAGVYDWRTSTTIRPPGVGVYQPSSSGTYTTKWGSPVTTTIIPIIRVTTTPAPSKPAPPAALLPRYLYWEPTNKQWLISPQVGGKESAAELSAGGNSKLSCPADTHQGWRRGSGVTRSGGPWTEDSSFQLRCAPSY